MMTMSAARLVPRHAQSRLIATACGIAASLALYDAACESNQKRCRIVRRRSTIGTSTTGYYASRVLCQRQQPSLLNQDQGPANASISTIRSLLCNLNFCSLPVPRLLQPRDPDLILPPRLVRQRNHDDVEVRRLQEAILQAIQKRDEPQMAELLKETYAVLYGKPTKRDKMTNSPFFTPQDRQDFLMQFGCTGWTEENLLVLCELARGRGIVEIGAGQGQWARAISDRFASLVTANEQYDETEAASRDAAVRRHKKPFDIVLAFDDFSALPLNADIYHKKTKAHQDYFFDKVQDCNNTSLSTILQSWACRGRVLLLVYPHINDMAIDALQAFVNADPERNVTVVYVGEGRGGVNANDKFFDALESGDWTLEQTMPVRVFGSKGYERMYIFKRGQKHHIMQLT